MKTLTRYIDQPRAYLSLHSLIRGSEGTREDLQSNILISVTNTI